jgi:hypothetical protein
MVRPTSVLFILPREAGKGDRRRRWKGRRRRSELPSTHPLHHALDGPPPPLRFTSQGRKYAYCNASDEIATFTVPLASVMTRSVLSS